MHPTTYARGLRLAALTLLGLTVGSTGLTAQEPVPPPRPVEPAPARAGVNTILIPIGISQTLRMSTKKVISAVRLNVDGIVRVTPNAVDPTSVILTGVSAGNVRLFLTDVDGKEEAYEVIVQLDLTVLKRILAQAVPTANVDVMPVQNRTVILTGWVAQAEDVDTILRVAQAVVPAGSNRS